MRKFTLFFAALLISMTAFAATPQTIYMKSSSSVWDQANAWFWVHFWGSGDVDVKMTKVEGETGLYSVEVPSGSTNCIFVRMNPASTSVSWDGKWNQTGNLTIPTDGKNMYTVTGWGETDGSWSTYTSVVTPDPEPIVHTYTLAGNNASLFGTEWDPGNTSNDLVDNEDGTWSKTYEDIVFTASTTIEFKVCQDYAWTNSWGENGGNSDASYTISEAGTYDVTFTFTLETKKTTVTATKQQTIDPGEDPTPEPEPEPDPEPDPEPTTYTIYFDNNGTGWTTVNAYCWTGDPIVAWPGEAMTPVEGHSGFFSYTTTQSYENIIFNNGSGTQTADLKVPTDGKNCYNGKTNTWSVYEAPVVPEPGEPVVRFTNLTATADLGATIKPEAEVENIENATLAYTVSYEGGEAVVVDATAGYVLNKYGSYVFTVVATGDNEASATASFSINVNIVAIVAGTAELCNGHHWSVGAVENAMYPVDGVYTITFENVPEGDHEFKVVYNEDWYGASNFDVANSTAGATGEDNIAFTLVQPTTITISFNSTTNKIVLVAEGIDEFGQFVASSYTLCGSAEIFGEADAPTLTDNDMTYDEETGVWSKTYKYVSLEVTGEEYGYAYKVAANHAWNGGQYPAGAATMLLHVYQAGVYNLTFTYNPNEETNPLRCEAEYMTPGVPEFAYASGYFTEDVLLVGILTSEADYEAGRDVCVLATVDGSDPSVDALATGATQVLRDGVQVAGDVTTVKALVVLLDENSEEDFPAAKDAKGNYIVSQVVERTYTKVERPAAPEFSVPAGQFEGELQFEIWPAIDENRDVYVLYTLDEEEPNPAVVEGEECSTLLSQGGVIISGTTIVKAIVALFDDEEGIIMKDVHDEYVVSETTTVKYTLKNAETTLVENAEIANIFTQDGLIIVDGEYAIFTVTGQNVTDMNGRLDAGVYVVRTANATAKVVIK